MWLCHGSLTLHEGKLSINLISKSRQFKLNGLSAAASYYTMQQMFLACKMQWASTQMVQSACLGVDIHTLLQHKRLLWQYYMYINSVLYLSAGSVVCVCWCAWVYIIYMWVYMYTEVQ